MAAVLLATVLDEQGASAALVVDERVHRIPERPTVRAILADWDAWLAQLDDQLARGSLSDGQALAECTLLAPLPDPANLYMAGANYADHAREMRKLPPSAPIPRPDAGPFFFLKPTTTLTGHRGVVRLPPGAPRVDWEVELGAVIGRRAHRVSAERALEYVAAYTVINDISVRDRFVREGAEPPMTYDWFAQKGWDTSCPSGPWLVPARDVAAPGDLALRLTLNGAVEQDSRTSEMIFSLEEQIAYLSGVVPLVPGDLICTGTCAGVGAGKGRFLKAGDVMVAEVEAIGALESTVVDSQHAS